MNYAIVFLLLGLSLILEGALFGGLCWLLLWPALSFVLVGLAYAGLGPGVFGKRSNGSLAWWSVILLLPYLLLTWAVWHVQRLLSREACCNQIAPGVWIGRRPLAKEVPAEADLLVDLTAEFPETRRVLSGRTYLLLPILDASVPEEGRYCEVLDQIVSWPGGVYIHCAQGHGRSGTVAVGLLLARGLAANVKEARASLRKARPGIALNRVQRDFLDRVWAQGRQAIGSSEAVRREDTQ